MLIIFLLLNINAIISETIKIKFNTLKFLDEKNKYLLDSFNTNNNIDENSLKEKYFYYDLILNNIYSEILIGNPPQKVIGFYSGKTCHFSLINDKCFIKNSIYNRYISNTFQNLSEFNINYNNYKNCSFATENFAFESYDLNTKIFFQNLKFFLTNDYKEKAIQNYCALIGLRLNYQDMFIENPKNFIYYLMQYYSNNTTKKKLKSFYWEIKYENNSGYISIGDPPHIYAPDNYKNKKFFEFNIQARYSTLNWAIQFKNIFLNKSGEIINLKKYNLEGHNCLFYPELNIILATNDFFNSIKKYFFNKYFQENICFIKKAYISEINSTIIEGLNGVYTLFYCEKNKIKDMNIFYNEFPSINFYHNLLNITFVLKGQELFYEENNKLYFLVANINNEVDQWVFGKVFLDKYQFVFNSEMKTIGFYKNMITNNKKDEKDFNIYYNNIIILIGFLIFLFALLSFIVYKCRKKYLKENQSIALEMKLI